MSASLETVVLVYLKQLLMNPTPTTLNRETWMVKV